MNVAKINEELKTMGYPNMGIVKIRKSRKNYGKQSGCMVYYVYVMNQPLKTTQFFRQRYPKLEDYNNRLIMSNGMMGLEFIS